MKRFLQFITDYVSTKKGMWITLSTWLIVAIGLSVFAPGAKEYETNNIQALPEEAKSIIAKEKLDTYFKSDDGIQALLVFSQEQSLDLTAVSEMMNTISNANIEGVEEVLPFATLPPQVQESFLSEDKTTIVLPVGMEKDIESDVIATAVEKMIEVANPSEEMTLRITGPAGIAADSLALFSRADVVLLLSTVGLILVLLIVIYRSPLLAFIPLFAAGFVFVIVDKVLGLMGQAGLEFTNQTFSVMTILLFAAVTDYSLFVFARYQEELKNYTSKYDAMKIAMRETGEAVFVSGGTVFTAMLVLFFASYGGFKNFAPVFSTAMAIIMLASITLVPALFTLFGRKAFWPKQPKVGDLQKEKQGIWNKVASVTLAKPFLVGGAITLLLVISSLNLFNLKYEFDTVKTFPADMPSREGYELIEEKFDLGILAPTTVLFESNATLSEEERSSVLTTLQNLDSVASVTENGLSEDGKVVKYGLVFEESPYSNEALNAVNDITQDEKDIIKDAKVDGRLYLSGPTANLADEKTVTDRDLIVIVSLITIMITIMLFFLTKSWKMPLYMMGTILVSFASALGLGTFLTKVLFDIDAISILVPVYAFVFLVALGVDYNIILISRYQEERKTHSVKEAIRIAVSKTGSVISSAGLILAATFAVLMTQPIAVLFVFGFIVAIGILLDTFLIRGILLPTLILFFEKDEPASKSVNQ